MIEKTLPTSYPLYETSYGNDIPAEQLFVVKFDSIPSKHNDNTSYSQDVIPYLKEQGFVEINMQIHYI